MDEKGFGLILILIAISIIAILVYGGYVFRENIERTEPQIDGIDIINDAEDTKRILEGRYE